MTSNHMSAMGKIAANIGKQPYAAPAEPEAPDNGQRAAVRFAVGKNAAGEVTCYWTIRYPDRTPNQTNTIYAFPLNGMGQDEFLREIVTSSINKITAHVKGAIRVAVHQDNLRAAYTSATSKHLTISVINRESQIGNHLSDAALAQLQQRIADEKVKQEQQALANNRSKALKLSGTSTARTIYVDASYMPGSESMGYGYVIKDVYNTAGDSKKWELTYGLGTGITSIEIGDDATGAELRAIRDVLLIPGVLNDDVVNNHRSLFIATDSKWSVTILKALREDKKQTHVVMPARDVPNQMVPVRQDWLTIARQITESLQGVETVTFQWVRGHNGDPLNEAADKLGRSARKNLENNASDNLRRDSKSTITSIMRNVLAQQGIMADVTEDATSAERNC